MLSMCPDLVSVGLHLLHRGALGPARRLQVPAAKRRLTQIQCTFRQVLKAEHCVQVFEESICMLKLSWCMGARVGTTDSCHKEVC